MSAAETFRRDVKCCGVWCQTQPVCAVCAIPCINEFDRIEVTPGVLPTSPDEITSLNYAYSSRSVAINQGNNPQTVTTTFAFSQALAATMTYAKAFAFQEKSTLDIGIPFLADGQLDFSSTQTLTTTTSSTDTRTTTYTTALQQQIPGFTLQEVNTSASASTIFTTVPVTIKTYYTCNEPEVSDNFAIIKTVGTIAATTAELQITYGPQYPIDIPPVYDQANATCASNPICSDLGLRQGNCCPDANGAYLPCCSFCVAKPSCEEYALTNTTMCCPARTNRWNPCCGPRP
jgi:hypothetical protein